MFICHLHITSPVSASHAAHAPRHIGIVTTAQPSGQKKQAQCRLTHPILHMPSIARKSAIDHLSLYPILSVTFKNQGILFPGRFPRPRVRLAAAGRCGVSPHGGKARIRATRGENSAVGGPSPPQICIRLRHNPIDSKFPKFAFRAHCVIYPPEFQTEFSFKTVHCAKDLTQTNACSRIWHAQAH